MKIVYLIHSLHTAGGMENILSSKANHLCAMPDMEVWIVAAHLKGRNPFFSLDHRVHLVDAGVNDRLFSARYRRRLQEILDEIRPDVSVSLCGSDVFQLLKCANTGARVAEYHFMHDKFYRKYERWPVYASLRTRELNAALEKYDALVVLSDYDSEYYRKVFANPEKVHKIGNTLSKVPSVVSSLDEKRFICVGRLSAEKNFADAVKIWKIVAGRHPDWRLDIYGEGKERHDLEILVDRAGLSGKVRLMGNCLSIMEEYAASSGLLVTSHYEGFGLVVLEAASCGVPTVAYSCPGGLGEMVSDGVNGYLVAEGDIEGSAGRVCALIEDEQLRRELGGNAREMSLKFTPGNVMSQWLELFEGLRNNL